MPWFLAQGVLNTVFALWTFGGSVFLLFLNELGLPKGQIGAVLALFPFCGVLALWFAPVATRWGWKRVFLAGYGIRKVVMALLLLLPWVLTAAGKTAGLIFLVGVIIVFALLRALAETAYYPWSQEFIPNRVRGKIAGISTMLGTLAAGVALGIAGLVIGHGTGLPRFLVLIAAGCVLGLLGVVVMAGGALAGLLLGWAADRVGSRPVLISAAAMILLVPLGWLLLPQQTPHAVAWCAALYFLNGVAASGLTIAAGRLLFNSVIPPDQSTAYTAIYYSWSGVTGGIAPLLAGALLTTCGNWQTRMGVVLVDGHGLLFLGALLLLAAGWWLYGRVRPDDRHTTRIVLKQLLEPVLQSRLLQIWR